MSCKSAKEKLNLTCRIEGCLNRVRRNSICTECQAKQKRVLRKCLGEGCSRNSHNEYCAVCTNKTAAAERRRLKEEAKQTPQPKKTKIEQMTKYLEKRGYSVEKVDKLAALADNIMQEDLTSDI